MSRRNFYITCFIVVLLVACASWPLVKTDPGTIAPSPAPAQWQAYLDGPFVATATKQLKKGELAVPPVESHEIQGIPALRDMLGLTRETYFTTFVYAVEPPVVSTAFTTWYDKLANHPTRTEWELYYPIVRAWRDVQVDDIAFIGLKDDRSILIVFAPHESPAAKFILWKYGLSPVRGERHDADTPGKAEEIKPDKAQLHSPYSFRQAKQILSKNIYPEADQRQTFYCGCDYTREGEILAESCGYKPRRPNSKRAKRLEWEHIVPAAYIGKGRACWEKGDADCKTSTGKSYKGRRCCKKVDEQFRRIEADMNNLVPEIGELNADRSNFPHREIEGEERAYGLCDFEVDFKARTAEPAVPLRGFIGRTWLYMHDVHGVLLTDEDKTVYQAWAKAYPPQKWEVERRGRIQKTLMERGRPALDAR